jgi:membrane protein
MRRRSVTVDILWAGGVTVAAHSRIRDIAGHTADRCRSLWKRAESLLPVRALQRFLAIDGKTRMVIMASQAFTTLVPLLIVIASINAYPGGDDRLATTLIHRFRLQGQAADALHTLFSRPPDAIGGLGILGFVLLLFSLMGLAKALQNTFEAAWGVPTGGLRCTLYRISGTTLFVAEIVAFALLSAALRGTPGAAATTLLVQFVESCITWLFLQYLLLSRKIPWRRLIPGAILAGAGQVIIGAYSAISMPNLIATNSSRYGIIGVSLALITWLLTIAAAIVIAAVAGAELSGQPPLTLNG